MSCHVFFSMSVGLKGPILVPAGTLPACQARVADVERALGLVAEKYLDNPAHWRSTKPLEGVDDKTYCAVAQKHNRWVRWLYHRLGEWSAATAENPPKGWWERRFGGDMELYDMSNSPPEAPDVLTPEAAQTFWHGLQEIDVPPARWTGDYYRDRMEHVYEVLRGRESEGVRFDARPLTAKQAAAVMNVFSTYLDGHDLRLDVPNGHDRLASSSDGGYDWCTRCGAMDPDEAGDCRKKACPLLADRDADLPEDECRRWVVKDKAKQVYLGGDPDEWLGTICKNVRRFDEREEAVAEIANHAGRRLVVVPVRRHW